jgi:hypothetical protein
MSIEKCRSDASSHAFPFSPLGELADLPSLWMIEGAAANESLTGGFFEI